MLQEQDWTDKIDDGGFLLVAVVAVGWYLWSDNRWRRSLAPLAIGFLSVVVQLLGLVLERDDPKAFGDNIGGAVYFVAVVLILAIQYWRSARLLRAQSA